MDVKCEKCGTEYEFDDRKISEAGITVKCTNCGHLFKVVRQRVSAVRADAEGSSREMPGPRRVPWMIRNGRGEVKEFKDLATLQQWIAQGKVSPADQISKSGETWKPLSSIIELSGMFVAPVIQTTSTAPPPPPPATAEDIMPSGQFKLEGPSDLGTPSPGIVRPIGSPLPGHPAGVHLGAQATPMQTSQTPYPGTPAPSTAPFGSPVYPSTPYETGQYRVGQVVTGAHHPGATGFGGEPSSSTFRFEDAGPPGYARPDQGAARGFAMGVLATVALAGVAYFAYDQWSDRRATPPAAQPAPAATVPSGSLAAPAPPPAETIVGAPAQAEGLAGLGATLAAAERQLEALGPQGEPAQRAAAQARAASAAIGLAEYARLADRPADLKNATAHVEAAEALAPDAPATRLARLDLARVSGAVPAAQAALIAAKGVNADPDTLRWQAAALTLHAAEGAAEAAKKLSALPAALQKAPRVRFLTAAALARSAQPDRARAQLRLLLTERPDHEPADALLRALAAAAPPVAGSAPSQPAAAATGAAVSAAPPSVAPSVAAAAAREAPPAARNAEPGGNYDALMRKGSAALERGRTQQARRYFDAALKKNPRSPEPWSNLAWCDLDEGQTSSAIRRFQQALERSSRYADAMFGLANAFEKSGRRADAVAAYERYLKAHRTGRHVRIARSKIEKLR